MAAYVYNRGLYLFATGGITASTDIRALLMKSSATFDATDNTVADAISGSQEISVSGYSRCDVSGLAITEDDGNGWAVVDVDNPTFAALAAGQTIGAVVFYVYNASDSSANLISWHDLTSATPTNGGDFEANVRAPGSGGLIKFRRP